MNRDKDLAYCAGIIDGEGYIGIVKQNTKDAKLGFRYRQVVQVMMKDKKPIEFLGDIFNIPIRVFYRKTVSYPM